MKKTFFIALSATLCTANLNASAQSELSSTARFLSNVMQAADGHNSQQTINRNGSYYDIQTWFRWMDKASAAWKSSDWNSAIEALYGQLNYSSNESVNIASCYIELGMLYMNTGNRSMACNSIEKAINIMRNSSNLGNDCEERAVSFLNKVRSGINTTFTYRDTCKGGVLFYVMEIPRAVFSNKMQAIAARYEAMGAYFDSMKRTYQFQGRQQASIAKFYANQEYSKQTGGKSFDPSRRPSYGAERDAWDACKKIHDIFGK